MNKLLTGMMAFVFCVSVGFTSTTFADTTGIGSQFDVKPVIPTNQDETITSYIKINTEGKAIKQEVSFTLKNGTDEAITVDLDVLTGVTASSGTIGYTADELETGRVAKEYQMKQYLTIPESVDLAPNELKTITGELNAPVLTGTLLGAVGFQERDKTEPVESTDAVSITSKSKRVIGVVVDFGDTDTINELEVTGALIERTPAMYNVKLDIMNNNPLIFSQSDIDYEVFDYENVSVFKSNPEIPIRVSFTPETNAVVSLPWESQTIEMDKTYTIKGTIKYAETTTAFTQTMTLEKEKQQSNPVSNIFKPDVIGGTSVWTYVVGGVVGLLVLSGIAFFVIRRRQYDEDED